MVVKPLPRIVRYTERDKRTSFRGRVVKEVGIYEKFDWGDYYKVIQEIKNERGEDVIRFGYYKKNHDAPDDEYQWGSQTTLMVLKSNIAELLELAKKEGIL